MSTLTPVIPQDEALWRKQFAQLAAAVKPYTFKADGALFIGDGCPSDLARTYGKMLLTGYAKGWL